MQKQTWEKHLAAIYADRRQLVADINMPLLAALDKIETGVCLKMSDTRFGPVSPHLAYLSLSEPALQLSCSGSLQACSVAIPIGA